MDWGYRAHRDGFQVGLTPTDMVGFHGATRAVQRSGAIQAAIVPTAGAAIVTTASALTSYGYTQAQADSIVTRINQILVDNLAMKVLLNELRAALVEKGLIAGA